MTRKFETEFPTKVFGKNYLKIEILELYLLRPLMTAVTKEGLNQTFPKLSLDYLLAILSRDL